MSPLGIRHVSGTFLAGECISVYLYGFDGGTKDAGEVARCLSGFSSRELEVIIGKWLCGTLWDFLTLRAAR